MKGKFTMAIGDRVLTYKGKLKLARLRTRK